MELSKKETGALVAPQTTQWELLQRQCKAFMESGFLPHHIKTLAQAITIAWKGHELGIPPLQAFSSIGVIAGKPVLAAELMVALIYQRVKGAQVTFVTPIEKQAKECTVEMQRPGGKAMPFRFTLDDAKAAGLVKPNSAWEKYPAAMLRARAVSAGARAVFPDAVMGCYTAEELGGEASIDGEIIVEPASPKPIGGPAEPPRVAAETHHEPIPVTLKQSRGGNANRSDFDHDPGFPE